jgi:hypothetical protein
MKISFEDLTLALTMWEYNRIETIPQKQNKKTATKR